MTKLFKGLGQFEDSEDQGSELQSGGSLAKQNSDAILGLQNDSNAVNEFLNSSNQDISDSLFTTQQLAMRKIANLNQEIDVERPVIKFSKKPQLFSNESAPAPFETLFNDFNLEATPYYNFWTPDETTNDKDSLGNRNLEDVPRYVELTWKVAPDLKDPDKKITPKTVSSRDIKPIMFSREIERPISIKDKGIIFAPEHLQARGFQTAKGMIANGVISAGVIEAVVDLPIEGTKLHDDNAFSSTYNIDEDSFLTNDSYNGISVHELQAQVNQLNNPIASISSLDLSSVSTNLQNKKDELVDGKVIISSNLKSGGKIKISSVHPSSPTLEIEANTCVSSKKSTPDNVDKLSTDIQKNSNEQEETKPQIKVKFCDTSIGGLIDKKKINLMKSQEHVDTAVAIAPSLPYLEMLSRTRTINSRRLSDPPSLPSPKLKPLEYIGYVIEKYVREQNGSFVKVDEIDIQSREIDYFIDTKVLYNKIYRYRIKALLRWTRPLNFNIEGKDVTVKESFASNAEKLAKYKSSYFSSEWGNKWSYASCVDNQPPPPPDEIVVRPESHKKRISISFKMPENVQRDISGMRLYRKIKNHMGVDVTDWQRIGSDFGPENVLFFDDFSSESLPFFQQTKFKFVYAATTLTKHGEESTFSDQLCARLNQDYFSKGEFPVEFVSCAGVRKQYTGNFSVYPHAKMKCEIVKASDPIKSTGSKNKVSVTIGSRNSTGNSILTDSKFIVRVVSLDTGEKKDIPLTSKIVNTPDIDFVEQTDIFTANYNILSKAARSNISTSNTNVVNNIPNTRGEEVIPRDYSVPGESYKTSG